ncbi:hypothetical protein AYI70_g4013 [Smittium culicis]|uniref:Urea active transporter 1 n=1 Tax=Smittium culicis TaxID=133412 RepID=A0A1R1Y1A4_9FUNG|nr:hypothetical protein AYI70_g4013 [Smittium culicis]
MNPIKLSNSLSNGLIYTSLGAFLIIGLVAGRRSSKDLNQFIKALYSKGFLSIGLNFVAVNVGSSLFYTLPEFGTIGGFLCFYLVGEFTTVYGAFELLTDLNPTVPVIILAVVTVTYSILFDHKFLHHIMNYTLSNILIAFGGVMASLVTDYIQIVAIGVKIKIPVGAPKEVGLLTPTKISYTSLYILISALMFSSMFHQGYWQRTFSSKSNRDLRIGSYIGSVIIFILFFVVGMAGPLAAWSGLWSADSDVLGRNTFFVILATMPEWLVAITLVLVTCLGCSAADTLICSLAGSIYDLTRNKLSMVYTRVVIVVLMVPIVIMAFKSPDILQIFLLADLLSSSIVLPILIGLIPKFNFVNEFDALLGAVFGLLSNGVFGTIYLGNSYEGWKLLLLEGGLYTEDNRVLGAFLVSPIGSLIFTFTSSFLRRSYYTVRGIQIPRYERKRYSTEEIKDSTINAESI